MDADTCVQVSEAAFSARMLGVQSVATILHSLGLSSMWPNLVTSGRLDQHNPSRCATQMFYIGWNHIPDAECQATA